MSIDADPQQQAAASPLMLVVRSSPTLYGCMSCATFTCGNCGKMFPHSEAVPVHLALRVVSVMPFGCLPARVCRACSGQVTLAGVFGVAATLAIAIAVLVWIAGR